MEKVWHVVDWIEGAVRKDAPWLQRRDKNGKIIRLNDLWTLDALYNLANKDFQKNSQRAWVKNREQLTQTIDEEVQSGAIKAVLANGDGTFWVQMLTPEAFRREGPRMGNCIGDGCYDSLLMSGSCTYYSLRDGKNSPHVTVEVFGSDVYQCQGKQCKPPISKHVPAIQNLFLNRGWDTSRIATSRSGLTMGREDQDQPYRAYRSDSLPKEKFFTKGDMDFVGLIATGLRMLPRELYVDGRFSIINSSPFDLTHIVWPKYLHAQEFFIEHSHGVRLQSGDNKVCCDKFTANSSFGLEINDGQFSEMDFWNCEDVKISKTVANKIHLEAVDNVHMAEWNSIRELVVENSCGVKATCYFDDPIDDQGAKKGLIFSKESRILAVTAKEMQGIDIRDGSLRKLRFYLCSDVTVSGNTRVDSLIIDESKRVAIGAEVALKALSIINAKDVSLPEKLCIEQLDVDETSSVSMLKEIKRIEFPTVCRPGVGQKPCYPTVRCE